MLRCGILFFICILLINLNSLFAQQQDSLDLEPIVITKNKIHLLSTYSLEFKELNDSALSSPIQTLCLLPLDLQSRSPKQDMQTDFSLRGSTFPGVLLLLDGQRINDPQTAHHNCDIPLTLEDIERIEVLPGVGSSVFGADAIGGAINFLLKKPKENKMVIELGGGSYQTKSGIFSISGKRDNLGIRLSLERKESDGFSYDTDFKKFTSRIDSSLELPDGEFNFGFGYQEKEFGAYDFYTPGLGYPSFEWTKTYLLNTGLSLTMQDFIIKPNFLWRRHYDKFMLDKTQERSTYLNHHRTDVLTPNIYFQKETDILGKIGFGLEYGEERINSTNLGKRQRFHESIFLDDSKDFSPKSSLGLSVRIDDFDNFDKVYTGSLNSRYSLSERDTLHFGVSSSIRIPSFTELYYSDPTTVGNPGLSAERALNYEGGYDCKKDNLALGITFFLRQERDFIDWTKQTPAQEKWQAENITQAKVEGIESYLKLKINQNLEFDSNYTFINKHIDDHGYLYKYGPNYIQHLVSLVCYLDLPFGRQSISSTYKKRPGRNGWFMLNTHLEYNLNKNSEIFLNITNLLNVDYQEIEGIPQPGRWIEAGLRLEW